MNQQITVALAGLSFGAAFIPIYKDHPNIGKIILCDTDPSLLKQASNRFGIPDRAESLETILDDPDIDAVHLVTPIPFHETQSLSVLNAHKHCACTVPMATTLTGLENIIKATESSGKNYMMMETSVYTNRFRYAKDLYESGCMGRLQFLRGAHYQDMEFWPEYWQGLPPMWYSTHAVSPLLSLSRKTVKEVHCYGSGVMRDKLVRKYGNPFPIETAIFDLGKELKAEVTRSLFHTARDYTESFSAYGDKMSFEWQQIETENPVVFTIGGKIIDENGIIWRGKKVSWNRQTIAEDHKGIPEEIRKYTIKSKYYNETNPQDSFESGGGHGGSHPYLVHEFVSSIIEGRKPLIDELTAAEWTAPGICAHESAMKNGATVTVPNYRQENT